MNKYLPQNSGLVKTAVLLLLISMLFIIHSCKKDLTKQEQTLTDPDITKVKDWYQSNFPAYTAVHNVKSGLSTSGTNTTLPSELDQYIDPDWANTNKYNRFNKDVYEIPINPDNKFAAALQNGNSGKFYANKDNSKTSFLILRDSAGYHAYVMTIIADSSYLKGGLGKLARNTYNKRDSAFAGMVFYFTPKGTYISSYRYKDGQLVSSGSNTTTAKSAQTTAANGKKVADVVTTCTDWYWVSYVNNVEVSRVYMFTTCNTIDNGDGSIGNGDNVGAPNQCPPGSTSIKAIHVTDNGNPSDDLDGGDGSTGVGFPEPQLTPCAVPIADILNNVKDPCLNKMVNVTINQNITTEINEMIQGVFGNPSYLNLTFTDQVPISQPNRDAEEGGNFSSNGDLTSVDIYLKAATLSGSSKEFIAATIMHEALHAFMDYQGINFDKQHSEMAAKYLNTMASDLEKMFPGMTDQVAYSLAWGGLEGTYLYSNPGDVPCPGYQPDINALYRAHTANGMTFGHGCN